MDTAPKARQSRLIRRIVPISSNYDGRGVQIEDHPKPEGQGPSFQARSVTPGYFAAMGDNPETGQPITTNEWIDRLAPKAAALVAVGTCATYGGVPAMKNNPTGAMGLPDYLGWNFRSTAGLPIVCIPGCPAQPDNLTEMLHAMSRRELKRAKRAASRAAARLPDSQVPLAERVRAITGILPEAHHHHAEVPCDPDAIREAPPLLYTPYRQDSTVTALVYYARTAGAAASRRGDGDRRVHQARGEEAGRGHHAAGQHRPAAHPRPGDVGDRPPPRPP